MIRPPRRAVTRFFIPLIDVLILLFCIFLLMPFVEKGAASGANLSPGEVDALRRKLNDLETKLVEMEKIKEPPEHLRQRIEELERELRKGTAERVQVHTFQIDPDTGALTYYEPVPGEGPKKRTVESAEKAEALIARHRAELLGTDKELLYLVQYPRDPDSDRPHRNQRDRYQQWFQSVTTQWETPQRTIAGGPKP